MRGIEPFSVRGGPCDEVVDGGWVSPLLVLATDHIVTHVVRHVSGGSFAVTGGQLKLSVTLGGRAIEARQTLLLRACDVGLFCKKG
jgi:hypothetical protein